MAGIDEIKPSKSFGMHMITEREIYLNNKERYVILGDKDLNVFSNTYLCEVA